MSERLRGGSVRAREGRSDTGESARARLSTHRSIDNHVVDGTITTTTVRKIAVHEDSKETRSSYYTSRLEREGEERKKNEQGKEKNLVKEEGERDGRRRERECVFGRARERQVS